MSGKHEQRNDDTVTMNVFPNGAVPPYIKTVMIIVERLGFPIFATGAIFFVAYTSQNRLTDALKENTRVLVEFKTAVASEHIRMLDEIKRLDKK